MFDLRPHRLIVFHGAEGVRREVGGDVPEYPSAPVVLAALDEAKDVWVGSGDRRVFSVGAGASAPVHAIPKECFDLISDGDRLIGTVVDGALKMTTLFTTDESGQQWQPMTLPRPVRATHGYGYSEGRPHRQSPDGAFLDTSPFGITVVEKGRGRVYVLRAGAAQPEGALQVEPGHEQDIWRAQATPHGVLLLLVINYRQTVLLHFALDGTLLASIPEANDEDDEDDADELTWGGAGVCVLDADRALLFVQDKVLLVSLPGLQVMETLAGEWPRFVSVTPAGADRWWVGPEDSDALFLLTAEPGHPLRLDASNRPVSPGAPLMHVGYKTPAIHWTEYTSAPLTVSSPVTETWRAVVRNDGTACEAVRIRVSGVLVGARVVDVSVRYRGQPLPMVEELRVNVVGVTAGLEGGATAELEVTFKPRGEGSGPLTITVEPCSWQSQGKEWQWQTKEESRVLAVTGHPASAQLLLTVE
ncbi:hypothetical protein [Corallococcus exiguus]|uniref:Uncharacterized protein n=1 Tax=Corallococcus exiguus TaxID=83462 RepID=A0A7X5BQJ8_9BACT|nr:hypothetical protein [Corallococcus exiguus]NBC39885.1 hypothetical protein [Corallococcus exiguus]TNV61357.1 hypothetical protein FH620_21390 [Corallococcus exiguus]